MGKECAKGGMVAELGIALAGMQDGEDFDGICYAIDGTCSARHGIYKCTTETNPIMFPINSCIVRLLAGVVLMGLDRIHLNKLLRLFLLKERQRATAIRRDAREEMKKMEEVGVAGGGHFQFPFWKVAKDHAAGKCDIREEVKDLVEKNWQRKRLYPLLQKGFLLWWSEKRRLINEPISELPKSIKSNFGFDEIEGLVKVENLLSLDIGGNQRRYIYPYFSESPAMTPAISKLGLWLMSRALPDLNVGDMRILDVIRGEAFSIADYPLDGAEEDAFRLRYRSILREWRAQFR